MFSLIFFNSMNYKDAYLPTYTTAYVFKYKL